jgi:hypothetical protein
MADDDALPPPLEIPWRLASTTQPLAAGEPDETAISLFVYEPEDESVTSLFPDQRLVFLKLTTTISPAVPPPNLPPIAGDALGEGVPCLHVLLDVRVRRLGGGPGSIRPYFHAAAPLARRTIQSGVVGLDVVEGEADAQFVGRSGSELHESSSTRATTTSIGGGASVGIGPVSIGGSARRTSTSVTGERDVSQVVDQTTRQASQERRELASHHTKVENVLTLLNAKYVGTPHLRFSLSPRPLQLLTIDPSDPNLWFNQLLQRRSSGIEGLQEFTAVVLVPRGEDFCVEARLRRVCVLDAPPGPFRLDEPFRFNQHLGRLLNYLDRVFPIGTPLEELDVDLLGLLPTPDEFVRPVLEAWVVSGSGLILAGVVSPAKAPGVVKRHLGVNYKHTLELWLEALRDEYERDVARSPLERGVLLGEERTLDTCLVFDELAGPIVKDSSSSVTPMFLVDVDRGELDLGGVVANASLAQADDVRRRGYEVVTRWNLLEQRLAVLLSNRRRVRKRDVALDDGRLVDVLVEAWAKLPPDDPRNLGFDAAADALGLGAAQRRGLKAAGATDLRTIAQALESAPALARHNERVAELRRTQKAERGGPPLPEPVKGALADAGAVRRAIARGLERGAKPSKR